MIEARNVTKRFGSNNVLNDLDFKVHEGGFVALLGPNGSGKTTFLRNLASLSRVDEGEVWVDGYRLPVSRFDVLCEGEIVASTQVEEIGVDHLLVFYQEVIHKKGAQQGIVHFYARLFLIGNFNF